jgi:predicted lipoprotein
VSVADLLAALAHDAVGARQHFGHSPGLSSTACFIVKGSGRITGIAGDSIKVSLDGATAPSEVKLSTGWVFGNTVRDATGLLNASDFSNSQDFNDISAELDHLVETRVLPELRKRSQVGKPIQFVGCLEFEEGDLPETIEIVPVRVELR